MDGKTAPHPGKPALRVWLAAGLLLVLCAGLAFIFRSRILISVADFLIVEDVPQPAGVIFLLNGDVNTRPFRAVELFQAGLAPAIAIARAENTPVVDMGLVPNETDIAVRLMQKLGVPPGSILVLPVPGGVTSTFDEAAALLQYVEANQVQRVILVTSAFHTRRARWIFERALSGLPVRLDVVAVPNARFDQTNWWKNESGLITLNNEYIKLVYYLFKYR